MQIGGAKHPPVIRLRQSYGGIYKESSMTKAQQEITTKQEVQVQKDLTPKVVKREISDMESNEAKLRAMWEYDQVPVRIVFRRLDGNTDPMSFSYLKYKWDKLTKYTMYHGQVHTIPRGVATHLRDDCKNPIYGNKSSDIILAAKDAAGNQPEVVGWNHRFAISSLDFSVDSHIPDHVHMQAIGKTVNQTEAVR